MIYWLLSFLRDSFAVKVPSVFFYYSTRMMLAAVTSLAICIFCGPWLIRKLCILKIGQNVRKEDLLGKLHENKQNTPTMGGVLILGSMLVTLLLWMDLSSVYTLILFLTTVVLGFVGGVDDYFKLRHKSSKGLSGRAKLGVQVVFSLLLALYMVIPFSSFSGLWESPTIKEQIVKKVRVGEMRETVVSQHSLTAREFASRVYVPFFKDPIVVFSGLGMIFAVLFMAFVITGASNAVNLTDGLDGLAAGCLIMAVIPFATIAFLSNNVAFTAYLNIPYISESGEIAIYLSAFIGACLGFLWYNGYPAQLFMGDTGSLALGGIVGVSAVLLKREFLLALVGGIFVMETLSVIIQVTSFRLRKKRVFLISPLHHHFEYKGWPETKVVLRFWIIGFLLTVIGLASLKFQ